jgi:hypothetical protein
MEPSNSIRYLKTLQTFIVDDFTSTRKAVATIGLKQLETDSTSGVVLKQIISELQQQDIINQRIEHLIEGLIKFPEYFKEKEYQFAFHRLQSLQLMAIGHDLKTAILNVRKLAAMLRNEEERSKGWEAILFTGNIKMKLVLELANDNILATTKGQESDHSILNPAQVEFCQKLYTTYSERTILQLFQTQSQAAKPGDLLSMYEAELKAIENNSVELF